VPRQSLLLWDHARDGHQEELLPRSVNNEPHQTPPFPGAVIILFGFSTSMGTLPKRKTVRPIHTTRNNRIFNYGIDPDGSKELS